METVDQSCKRVGRPKVSAEDQKRRKRLYEQTHKSRIYLGSEFERWQNLKQKCKMKTDRAFVTMLIDHYMSTTVEPGCILVPASEVVQKPNITRSPLAPTAQHRDQPEKTNTDMSNLSSIYAIRGLPLNVPFKVHFETSTPYLPTGIPTILADDSDFEYHSTAYIILEYNVLNLNLDVVPVSINIKDNIVEASETEVQNDLHKDIVEKCSVNTWVLKQNNVQSDKTLEPSVNNGVQIKTEKETIISDKTERDKELEIYLEGDNSLERGLLTTIKVEPETTEELSADSDLPKQNVKCKKQIAKPEVEFKKKLKIVVLEGPEANDNDRRQSSRMNSKGFRPDYSALDELDVSSDDIGTDTNDELFDSVSEDDSADVDMEAEGVEQDKGNALVKSVKEDNDGEKKVDKHIKKKHKEDDPDDPDYMNSDCSDYVKVDDKKAFSSSESNDSWFSDIDLEDLHIIKNSLNSQNPDHGSDKEKQTNGMTKEKLEKLFKKKENIKIQYFEELKEKRIKAYRAKMKKRIKVRLEEHSDKYYKENQEKIAMKDRCLSEEEKVYDYFCCAICKRYRTLDKTGLEFHIEGHLNEDFNCKRCDFKASGKGALFIHFRDKHKTKKFKCQDCDEMFFMAIQLKTHRSVVHNEPIYSCSHCVQLNGKPHSFQNIKLQKEHYLENHEDQMKKCDKCSKLFMDHMRHKCMDERPFPCEICGKLFKGRTKGLAHKLKAHDHVRNHPCPHCSHCSVSGQKLKHHIQARHTETGKHNHHCEHCSFSCVQRIQLTSHMRTHSGDKPFKCDQCTYAACWNVQLKDHKKLHGLPCAVTCDVCGILVKNNKCLHLHNKREHAKKYDGTEPSPKKRKTDSNAEKNPEQGAKQLRKKTKQNKIKD